MLELGDECVVRLPEGPVRGVVGQRPLQSGRASGEIPQGTLGRRGFQRDRLGGPTGPHGEARQNIGGPVKSPPPRPDIRMA